MKIKKHLITWLAVLTACILFSAIIPCALAAGITEDDITASGCTYPTTLTEGQGFSLKGVVTSDISKIVKLVAGVFNAKGTMVTGRNWNPNKTSVDFRWYVNPHVEFGTLAAGTYTYKIIATNGSVKKTLLSQSFEVTPGEKVSDDLSLAGGNYPEQLTQGSGFSLRGVVSSKSTNISNLEVGVYSQKDKLLTGRNWNPKAKSVDLRWYVNKYVKFGTLDAGTYTYKITATNGAGKKTLLSQIFVVIAADPVSDGLTASGCTYPEELTQGSGFSLRGVVTSGSSNISSLTAGVFNEKGKMLTGRTFNPKAKSVDFRWAVNPYVKFGTLGEGTYTYKILATNAAGQQTLLSESFDVLPPEEASDTITGAGLNAPAILNKGRGFAIRGVVSSQTSKISLLTAGVFDGNGKMLTGRSWDPKSKSVDLRWYVNEYVKFGKLEIGTYTYKVIATNDTDTATLLEAAFEVVE